MRFAHAVSDEVQRVRGDLPVGDDLRQVSADGEVSVLVDGLPDATQVPPILLRDVLETREVEWLLLGDDEVIADPWILPDDLLRRPWGQEAIVTPPASDLLGTGLPGLHQSDAPIGVDPEDPGMRVEGRPVVHPYSVAPLKHRFVATVEPHARLNWRRDKNGLQP